MANLGAHVTWGTTPVSHGLVRLLLFVVAFVALTALVALLG